MIADMLKRWQIFIGERFPPVSHLPMAVLFALANVGMASRCTGSAPAPLKAAGAFVLVLSFLFRLRCFDEIKDYATDVQVNPGRPLPRGVLTLRQVKAVIGALTIVEVALAACFGWPVVLSHLLAVGYSFLMYREFFIGRYLRPLLTLYAVTHTCSLLLLGWSVSSLATGRFIVQLPPVVLLFGLANWLLFNIFEFARKSWARDEEVTGVESYSSLYGAGGAVVLTMTQAVGSLFVLYAVPREVVGWTAWFAALAITVVLALAGLIFALRERVTTAKAYRAAAAGYLLLFYALLVWATWR